MFAAEVQFYAMALINWKGKIPFIGDRWNNSAVIADMSFGEEIESGWFDSYYNPNNRLVVQQGVLHGIY